MYVAIVAGGIASGKSTVARHLAELGCVRIDLDELSREVTASGSDALGEIAGAFGADLIDEKGELRRALLAERAFASAEKTRLLESIVHPRITRLLMSRLAELEKTGAADVVVIEVPLLDRVSGLIDKVDEVVVVTCPYEVRRERAIGRGMDGRDFDARAKEQPTDEWLASHADTVIENSGSDKELMDTIDAWFKLRS